MILICTTLALTATKKYKKENGKLIFY